jgi:putative restriction endonuclease
MEVRFVVAITDQDWFDHLQLRRELTDANVWSPGAAPFRVVQAGELFLFKLRAPLNCVVSSSPERNLALD